MNPEVGRSIEEFLNTCKKSRCQCRTLSATFANAKDLGKQKEITTYMKEHSDLEEKTNETIALLNELKHQIQNCKMDLRDGRKRISSGYVSNVPSTASLDQDQSHTWRYGRGESLQLDTLAIEETGKPSKTLEENILPPSENDETLDSMPVIAAARDCEA